MPETRCLTDEVAGPDSDLHYQIPLPTYIKVPLLTPWWNSTDLWTALQAILGGRTSERALIELAQRVFRVAYVIPTNSGSSALLLGLKALGLGSGDEVVVQSMICRSPVQAIVQAGCRPVFADVGDDYNLDPAKVEERLSSSTKAIVMVNMFGKMANVEAIQDVAKRHGLFLIDDAAVSAGAQRDGKMSGTFGDFGIVSFNIGKNMIAGGGGLLLTDLPDLYRKVAAMDLPTVSRREMWRQWLYVLTYHRFKSQVAPFAWMLRTIRRQKPMPMCRVYQNTLPHITPARMSPLNSAIALRQLKRLSEIVQRCVHHAKILSDVLTDTEQIQLPVGEFPENVYVYYPISVKVGSRYELGQFLRRKGVETKWSYYPVHLQDQFRECRRGNLENTERLWHRLLYLPADASLSEPQVVWVGDAVREFFRRQRRQQADCSLA